MSVAQIRRFVDSVMRKFHIELTAYRLRPDVAEYCDQWRELTAKDKLPPNPKRLIHKLPNTETLRSEFAAVHNYLDRCRLAGKVPIPDGIISLLFPRAATRGLLPNPLGMFPR